MKWIPIPPTPRNGSCPRALLRRALSPFWVAVPFAVFFGFLFRAGWPGRRSDTLREVASYVTAAMLGAVLAGVIVNWLVLPGFLGSTHSIVAFFMFSVLFCALFTGIAFAFRFHGAFIARVRSEEQYKTRVEHDIRTALAIQQALMPTSRRLPPLFDVAGAAPPRRSISGDFLDYF